MIPNTLGLQVETRDGFVSFSGIATIPTSPTLTIQLANGSSITCSYNHRFVINGCEIRAFELLEGEILEIKCKKFSMIKKIIMDKSPQELYDLLDVDSHDNTYYTNDINSHNCKFLGSSPTLVDSAAIEKIKTIKPKKITKNNRLEIWEDYVPNALYIIAVDPAEGTKQDYSVAHVLKINGKKDIVQVAKYRSNEIDFRSFGDECIELSKTYGGSYMMIENNSIGSGLCEYIWNVREYDMIINTKKRELGIRSTKKSKLLANLHMKNYIEKGYVKIVDSVTKFELSVYEEAGGQVWKATGSNHDDTVTSLMWGLWFVETEFFDEADVSAVKKSTVEDNGPPNLSNYDSEFFGEHMVGYEDDMGHLLAFND